MTRTTKPARRRRATPHGAAMQRAEFLRVAEAAIARLGIRRVLAIAERVLEEERPRQPARRGRP